ncbi:MAG: OmpA family protein [Planctomycetota bacterium]
MSPRRAPLKDEPKLAVPRHMVSFADMMTNLLCFFIMLCAFAQTQQVAFAAAAIGSFREALMNLGLPGLLSSERTPIRLDAPTVQFKVPRVVPIDKDAWHSRRELERQNDMASLPQAEKATSHATEDVILPSGLVFLPGSAQLPPGAQARLERLALLVRQHPGVVEIEGHASAGETTDEQLLDLSLRRALAVQRQLGSLPGVPPRKLRAVGFGAARKLVQQGEEGSNSRVVLRFLH